MHVVRLAATFFWSPVLRKFPHYFSRPSEGCALDPLPAGRSTMSYEHHPAPGARLRRLLPQPAFQGRASSTASSRRLRGGHRPYLNRRQHQPGVCAYPHSDSTWPHAPESAMKYLADVPRRGDRQITHLIAMPHLPLRPLLGPTMPRCTVEALRSYRPRRRSLMAPSGDESACQGSGDPLPSSIGVGASAESVT